MLKDGTLQAIKNIRKRKGLTQGAAGKRVGITGARWSKLETGGKNLTPVELPIILAGLECSEIELWEEKVRVERDLYRQQASEIGEPTPGYDTSGPALWLEALYRLDAHQLSPEEQQDFNDLRNSIAATISSALVMADRLKTHYRSRQEIAEEPPRKEDDTT